MQTGIFERPKAPLGKVLQLFVEILIVGILIGGLAALVGRFIYLIIVFPVLMGLGAALVIKAGVVVGKIRSVLVVSMAGIFAVIVIYGSMHFFDYLWFRSDAAKAIQKEVVAMYGQAADSKAVQVFIDQFLIEKTGSPGFIGFILLEAKEGVSISRVESSNDAGLNLGAFTWVYWLIEMGLIGWPALSEGHKAARQPFCEHCDAWVGPNDHIGGVKPEAFEQAMQHIKTNDYTGLVGLLKNGITMPSVEFYTRTCTTCNTFPFYLTGFVLSQGRKGQTVNSKLVVAQVLNASQRFALTDALKMTRNTEYVRTEQ